MKIKIKTPEITSSLRLVLVSNLMIYLTGCGFKGPLVMPNKNQPTTITAESGSTTFKTESHIN